MKNLIARVARQGTISHGLAGVIQGISRDVQSNGGKGLLATGFGISMESLNEADQENIAHDLGRLSTALEGYAKDAGLGSLAMAQKEAALGGALVVQQGVSYLKGAAGTLPQSTDRVINKMSHAADGVDRLTAALEAYDDASNRNMAAYTVTYNMQAAQQDAFGEAFYPTVVVTRDQVGYMISIQLITVMKEITRKTSGDADDFKRRNIIFALRDPSILRNQQTKIVPVVRAESASKFVDPALVPVSTIDLEGEAVATAPLKFSTQYSLIAISQVDSLVSQGLMDMSDAVDRDVHLQGVYMQVGGAQGSVIYFPTKDLFTANFVFNPQGSEKKVTLNFDNKDVGLKSDVKAVDGAAPSELSSVAADMTVGLHFVVNGSLDLQTGNINLLAGDVAVSYIQQGDKKYVPGASGNPSAITAVFTALAGAKLIGYDLDARRTNSNKRQRGDLLDITVYNQCYSVPLLSPITAPRPLGQGDDTDTSDLNALITTTRVRASNGAVDELLRVKDVLARYVDDNRAPSDTVDILGPSRYIVSPFFEEFELDLGQIVNSVQSHNLAEDIQAAIIAKAREMAFRMIRDSGWKQAASALSGGNDVEPVVIMGTDQVIEGWLMTTGDTRTLGNGVSLKIVSTPNRLMNGKIIMTLAMPNASEGVPNVLNFGNMAYQPEIVMSLPIHRNGQNSKELTVQPSFRHITNLPIMAVITVKGWELVVDKKVPIHNHPV